MSHKNFCFSISKLICSLCFVIITFCILLERACLSDIFCNYYVLKIFCIVKYFAHIYLINFSTPIYLPLSLPLNPIMIRENGEDDSPRSHIFAHHSTTYSYHPPSLLLINHFSPPTHLSFSFSLHHSLFSTTSPWQAGLELRGSMTDDIRTPIKKIKYVRLCVCVFGFFMYLSFPVISEVATIV